jgi:hypothetical protein
MRYAVVIEKASANYSANVPDFARLRRYRRCQQKRNS